MALIIRSRFIKPTTKSPCANDCKDRKINCHSQCTKYIEWHRAYMERKKAIKDYNKKIADCEEYEIQQKLKNLKKKGREI